MKILLTILLFPSLVTAYEFKNECVTTKSKFAFQVVLDAKYENGENYKSLYQINCDREARVCDGVKISLNEKN